jgi:uncharacterized protein
MWYSDVMNLEETKQPIQNMAQKHNLQFVILFGSQATGNTHAKSDIDIAVISRDKVNTPRLMSELSEIFKRDDVQVVDLGLASPTLMYAVVKDGKALYENSQDAFLTWKLYAIKVWMETSWLRVLRDKKIVEWTAKTV